MQYDEPSTDYAIIKTSHGVSELVFALRNFDLLSLYRLQLFSFLVGQQKILWLLTQAVFSLRLLSRFSAIFAQNPVR